MRHRKVNKKLGRTASHRKALISNVATALFEHKQIKTTTVKAKEIRRFVERLITFAKRGTLADRRQVLRTVRNKRVVRTLFEDIAPTYQDRNGGYTRVVRLGRRRGDGAEVALLELVGYEGVLLEKQRSKEEQKSAREKKKEKEKEKEKGTETEQ
ncbi:MAG: 50S ribosomal protein L17 [bacterium]